MNKAAGVVGVQLGVAAVIGGTAKRVRDIEVEAALQDSSAKRSTGNDLVPLRGDFAPAGKLRLLSEPLRGFQSSHGAGKGFAGALHVYLRVIESL